MKILLLLLLYTPLLADIHVIHHGVKHDTPALPMPATEIEYKRPREIMTPAKAHRRWYKKHGLIPRIPRIC